MVTLKIGGGRLPRSKSSAIGRSTWVMDTPVMYQPSKPDNMVASNRAVTETFLVTSSARPNTNAGTPASSNGPRKACRSGREVT
jgi:hypothetical protein